MEYIAIGKIVNTHGIKGELRLLSKFKYKEKVFIKNMDIYIGKYKEKETINSYRHHKNFEMITLKGYDNINQVLKYKGLVAYINKEDLNLNDGEYLDKDLLNLDVYIENKIVGKVIDINDNGGNNKTLTILIDHKKSYIPLNKEFVKIDLKNKQIIITPIEGMII